MEYSKTLPNGKVMTLCIHCNRVSHTYREKCTACGKLKDYHFFFSLPEGEREKLLEVLTDYHKQNLR